MSGFVRCSCGWVLDGHPVMFQLVLRMSASAMVSHWELGHDLTCPTELTAMVKEELERYAAMRRGRSTRVGFAVEQSKKRSAT